MTKPSASSCCLATSDDLYMNSYSRVLIQRTVCPA